MRKLAVVVVLVVLVAMPVAAAPVDQDHAGTLSFRERVIEVVTGWLTNLGADLGAKSDPDDDDRDPPPFDGVGAGFDPIG